jgi:hypothetical protein
MKMKNVFFGMLVCVLSLGFVFIGCTTTLSAKAQQENIRATTSLLAVEGMEKFHTYQANYMELCNIWGEGTSGTQPMEELAINAANKAANEGHSNIIVLLQFIGGTGNGKVYEISYWR